MKREQLIKKAQEIESRYYQAVKDSRELWKGDSAKYKETKAIQEWSIAMEVMAELLEMDEAEYFEYFMNETAPF